MFLAITIPVREQGTGAKIGLEDGMHHSIIA